MYALIDEAPVLSGTDDDSLDHAYCECDKDTSLCGRDITTLMEIPPEVDLSDPCVVCEGMTICPQCGFIFTEDD